jgi:adenylyl- and sulfurtransferase ThiI
MSDGVWGTLKPLDRSIHHLPSIFSGKPDPSLHRDRLKRLNLSAEEKQMKLVQRKAFQAEARDIQNLAKQFSIDAMQTFVDILHNPDSADAAKITAANAILDRAYGKAAMTTFNVNANLDAKPKELDGADLDKRIADAITRTERLTERETEEAAGEERPSNLREYN